MTATPRTRSARLLAAGLAWAAVSACASPGVTPVQEAGAIGNPATGPAVRIDEVVDRRGFQDYAGHTLTPTLAGDVDRSRAVGRSTQPGGAAGENVLLAPGLRVEDVASEAVSRALRSAGFRVLAAGDPGANDATALRVTIEQLWMMRRLPSPGGSAEVEIRVRIAGPIGGLDHGTVVSVRDVVSRESWTPSLWRITLEKGLDELTRKAVPELEAARAAVEVGRER